MRRWCRRSCPASAPLKAFASGCGLHSRTSTLPARSARPSGFCVLKGEELYQLFVSSEAHGSGVAAALIAEAEARLAERGVETAWLACAMGNDRAARFYEKSGWRLAGTFVNSAETSSGPFPLEEWRYEKRLTRST